MIAPSVMHGECAEVSTAVRPYISTAPVVDGLAYRLCYLREVSTRPDFYAVAQRHARGKLTVQEKTTLLFDAGTFMENMVPSPDLDSRHGARRLVTGHGQVQGRLVAAALFEASVAAGAVTIATGEKLIAQMRWAEAHCCPLLIDWDSGGADINDGVASLHIVRQIFTQIAEISGRIPTLSLISGLNAGVGAYAPVMTDTVIMIDGSMMAVTGPRVIKVATGEDVTPEEMGGTQLHSERSGEAHYRVADYPAAARLARRYLSYLPQSMWSFPPHTARQDKRDVPTDLRAVVTQARQNARLKRLTDPAPRPLLALEILWQLAEALEVPLFDEEHHFREALGGAIEALWTTLSASPQRYVALVRAAVAGHLEHNVDYGMLCRHLQAAAPHLAPEETAEFVCTVLGWLSADMPPITLLLKAIESTQLHACLVAQDDLFLSRPAFLEDEATVARLHRLLSTSLRPVVLRHDELCSPMAATIYHRPEPSAPAFVQIGAEVHVGQTLALLEAMKMFTELTSPVNGVLVDILVEDGQGVHTGTPLFKIATHDAAIEATDDVLYQRINGSWQNRFGLLLMREASVTSRALLGRDARSYGYAA